MAETGCNRAGLCTRLSRGNARGGAGRGGRRLPGRFPAGIPPGRLRAAGFQTATVAAARRRTGNFLGAPTLVGGGGVRT